MTESLAGLNMKLHADNMRAASKAKMDALEETLAGIISKNSAKGRLSAIIHDNRIIHCSYDLRWNDGKSQNIERVNADTGILTLMSELSWETLLWLGQQGVTRLDIYDDEGRSGSVRLVAGRAVNKDSDVLSRAGTESLIILSWEDNGDDDPLV